MAPPIAGDESPNVTTMDALAQSGAPNGRGQSGGPAPNMDAMVSQIREYTQTIGKLGEQIPSAQKEIQQIQSLLRQIAVKAAQAGATQNGSANALPV